MNRIKKLRLEKGITQSELATFLQISDRAIGYYENGEREPDYDTLKKIADYFGVTTDYLLGISEYPTIAYEAYAEALELKKVREDGKEELMIGLSKEDKNVLTDEDKAKITEFAEFVAKNRKERK